MANSMRIIAGAMSGTSADGVDVALVRIFGHGREMIAEPIAAHFLPYPTELRQSIFSLRSDSPTTLSVLAQIGTDVSRCYASAVNECLRRAGMSADQIAAVAAHGQTLYHSPPQTIQWLDPALLAAEVGAAVVSDFRRADCAAGGQGAPLVPLADYLLFRHPTKSRVLLNIGGIANMTFLRAGGELENVIAFDTGPGNCISDHLMRRNFPNGDGFDDDGKLAARGKPVEAIVRKFLDDGYFTSRPPKSTDGPGMIAVFSDALKCNGLPQRLEDLLHSACVLTARTISQAMRSFLNPFPDEIIVSGGGTRNGSLMRLLREMTGNVPIINTDELGIASSSKEAIAFALLGAATLDGLAGNVPSATGAQRAVILGSITPWK